MYYAPRVDKSCTVLYQESKRINRTSSGRYIPCRAQSFLNLNFAPTAAKKSHEQQGSSNHQIREHCQPCPEQPPVATRPDPQHSQIDALQREQIGQRNSQAQKSRPREKNGHSSI